MRTVESTKYHKLPIYIAAVFLSFILVMFLITAGVPHYDTNDDVTLNNIAAGNYGEHNSSYLVFSNICYGKFLSLLYTINSSINWYAVFPIVVSVLTLQMLTIVLVNRATNSLGILLSMLVIYFFGQFIFIRFQFTHLAGYFSAVGLFFLYVGLMEDTRLYRFYTWIGVAVAFLGFCFRKDAFLAVAAIIGTCCFVKIIRYKFWTVGFKQIIRFALPFIILFFAIGVASGINYYTYHSDADWYYWTEYNTLRASLLDYPTPSYEQYADKYQAIGIDQLDLQMLFSWNYGDKNKFSLETMAKLCELQEEYLMELHSSPTAVVKDFLENMGELLSEKRAFLIVAALSLGTAFWEKKNLWIILPVIMLGAELFYLSYCGRFIFRTYLGMWIALSLIVFFETANLTAVRDWRITTKILAIPLAFVVILIPWLYSVSLEGKETKARIAEYEKKYTWRQVLSQDKETLYIHETLFGGVPDSLTVFEPIQKYNHNIYCLGGWTNPSPLQEYLLDKFDIDECGVIEGLLDEEKSVYYMELDGNSYRERFLTYLRKEYGSNVQMEQVNRIENLNIFRFFIDESTDESSLKIVENLMNSAISMDLRSDFLLETSDTSIVLHGWCYTPVIDSYKQTVWLRITEGSNQIYIKGNKCLNLPLAEVFDDLHAPAAGVIFDIDPAVVSINDHTKFEIFIEGNGQMITTDISKNIRY